MIEQQPKSGETEAMQGSPGDEPTPEGQTPKDTGQADYGSAGQQAIEETDGASGQDR